MKYVLRNVVLSLMIGATLYAADGTTPASTPVPAPQERTLNTYKGPIQSVVLGAGQIRVQDNMGNPADFVLNEETKVSRLGKEIFISEVKAGDVATILYDPSNMAIVAIDVLTPVNNYMPPK